MASPSPHPFDPLTPEEIQRASALVRPRFAGHRPNFRVVTLKEPPKKDMVAFLEREHAGSDTADCRPPRTALVQVVADGNALHELTVDLDEGVVRTSQHLEGRHSYIDAGYMEAVEEACLADAGVQAELGRLELPPGATVCVEPWAYATDGANDMSQRTTMCWFYMRLADSPDANYYAYPLDLCAEVSEALRVAKVYHLPTAGHERTRAEPRPFDRRKLHAAAHSEYHPSLRPAPRQTTRPYRVEQPGGPSFERRGGRLAWERWTLRVGFNYREGLTLHDVRHDGRSLFYRLSLAEMFVPYADPRPPFPRKGAFDVGNDGAGVNANWLRPGCDCLGVVSYLDGWHTTRAGEALRLPSVVCCHEQDDGILWKHTSFRTRNAVVARARVLVLQTIITVSNYEYIFAFLLGQDASIHYEVRATGILSTVPTAVGEQVPYGTVVAPGVLAPSHQHLFCLRIDPALDGHANSLQVEESRPMAAGGDANPQGVGFVTQARVVEREQGLDLDFASNRTFKIVNERVRNPVTGTPVGFKLVPCYSQLLLASPQSFHARRAEFARHAVWVTRHDDDEMFPAGRHTMQSPGGEGIASAIERRRGGGRDPSATSVRDEDIVVWHTFGTTHNPRLEDWPVMPCDRLVVGLKPVNFFGGNPGIDVAPSGSQTCASTR